MERLTGYSLEEVVGRKTSLLKSGGTPDSIYEEMWKTITDGRVWTGELVNRRKDGSLYTEEMTITPVILHGDKPTHYIAIKLDATEKVAAREALTRARKEAERASRMKSAFLANMSHEIRTPMNGVIGMTDILLNTDLTPEQRQTAELVLGSAESLLTVINDILDFSKVEAGQLILEETRFDLVGLVEAAVRVQAAHAQGQGLEVVCDIRPGVPRNVVGDPDRLRQVLTNLVGNAIKFTHEGEVVVTISVENESEHSRTVRFSVRDTGIGIAAEQLENIFMEFMQADSSTTREYGGTGLGLAISRHIVELMGGALEVTSEAGVGSEFSFVSELTLAEGEEPQAYRDDWSKLREIRALVVDDNETNRRIICEILNQVGVDTAEAESAPVAMALLIEAAVQKRPFQLVIIDSLMPGQDGFDLAGQVRECADFDDLPLMMLTSGGQLGDGERCRQIGISAYLPKPISRFELLQAAAALLSDGDVEAHPGRLITQHSIEEARRSLRILLAEDNPVNQLVAATMLRKRGHTVDVVANGLEAVEAATTEDYDVILMDIQMPELDGMEAMRRIRRIPEKGQMPIIALTAHALAEERQRFLAEGMNAYLSKPFKPHKLFALVEGWDTSSTESAEAEEPEEVPVNLEELKSTMREAGVEEAVDGILDIYRQDAPGRMRSLEEAADEGDIESIRSAAHAFKASSGGVGAKVLAELLRRTESAAASGSGAEAVELVAAVGQEFRAVDDYLRGVLGSEEQSFGMEV